MERTQYASEAPSRRNQVVFIVNETGVKLARDFDSPFLARRFASKIGHSTKYTLVSWPSYD